MLSEAMQFWGAISGKIKSVIQQETANTFRCERYEVTTAPNGTVVGVTKAFGEKEILLPYSKEVESAIVGQPVLVVWWGSMSNAKVYYYANGYNGGGGITLDAVYPVGSIYMSVNNTDPAILFGGTWQQIEDTFLLAAGSTYAAGATGGSATNSHTHYEGTLKAAIGATGGAPISIGYSATDPSGRGPSSVTSYTVSGASWTNTSRSFNHYTPVYGETAEPSDTNNMPPYLTVYMWQRTA